MMGGNPVNSRDGLELDDLRDLFQPKLFYDSMILYVMSLTCTFLSEKKKEKLLNIFILYGILLAELKCAVRHNTVKFNKEL